MVVEQIYCVDILLRIMEIDIDKIKTFLKQHLPGYMVPSKMMQLDDFPRNQNNKIDKNSLPMLN